MKEREEELVSKEQEAQAQQQRQFKRKPKQTQLNEKIMANRQDGRDSESEEEDEGERENTTSLPPEPESSNRRLMQVAQKLEQLKQEGKAIPSSVLLNKTSSALLANDQQTYFILDPSQVRLSLSRVLLVCLPTCLLSIRFSFGCWLFLLL